MELVGEEKRIQALFSELRLEDQSVMPRFATVWNRAELSTVARRSPFRLSFGSAMALIVCVAIFSFALAMRNWRGSQNPVGRATNDAILPGAGSIQITKVSAPKDAVDEQRRSNPKRTAAKLAARRRQAELIAATRKAARDAAAISRWQSPTSALLRSPSDEVFTSLPQLDEGANELKSFLPKTPQ